MKEAPYSHTLVGPNQQYTMLKNNPVGQTFELFIKENRSTVQLTNVELFPPVTQLVKPCSGSNMTQVAQQCGEKRGEKNLAAATPLIGYSASGVFLCVEHRQGFSRDQVLPESGWFTWSLQQCGNESR